MTEISGKKIALVKWMTLYGEEMVESWWKKGGNM